MSSTPKTLCEETLNDSWVEVCSNASSDESITSPVPSFHGGTEEMLLDAQKESSPASSDLSGFDENPIHSERLSPVYFDMSFSKHSGSHPKRPRSPVIEARQETFEDFQPLFPSKSGTKRRQGSTDWIWDWSSRPEIQHHNLPKSPPRSPVSPRSTASRSPVSPLSPLSEEDCQPGLNVLSNAENEILGLLERNWDASGRRFQQGGTERRQGSTDWIWDWSSSPNIQHNKEWNFHHPSESNLSMRNSKYGKTLFSNEILSVLIISNILCLMLGAGIGLFISKKIGAGILTKAMK